MKKDKLLRKKQADRLTDEIINVYGLHGDSPKIKDFLDDVNLIYNKEIHKPTISNICSGKTNIDNYVQAFAQVLNVTSEWLLCEDGACRTLQDKKDRYVKNEDRVIKRFTDRMTDNIARIKRVTDYMENLDYKIRYELSEPYSIGKDANDYLIYGIGSDVCRISCERFLLLIANYPSGIQISEDIYIHLRQVHLIQGLNVKDKNGKSVYKIKTTSIKPDDYLRMIRDIDGELSHRLNYWMWYHGEDNASSDSIVFWNDESTVDDNIDTDTDTDATDTGSEIVIEPRTQKEIDGRMKSLGDKAERDYKKEQAKTKK